MKSFTLLLCVSSFAAFSATPYFFTNHSFNNVHVRGYNNDLEKDYRCQGTIYVWTTKGRFLTRNYYRTLFKRQSDYQSIYFYLYNDQIRNSNHSIFCQEIRS